MFLGLCCFDTFFHWSTGNTTANWLLEFKYSSTQLLLYRNSRMVTKLSRVLWRILRLFTTNGRNHTFTLCITASIYSLTLLQRQFELVHLHAMHNGLWRLLLAILAEKFAKTKIFSETLRNAEYFMLKSTPSWQCIQNLTSIMVWPSCLFMLTLFQMVMLFYHDVTMLQGRWQISNTMHWWYTGSRLDGLIRCCGTMELFVGGTWLYLMDNRHDPFGASQVIDLLSVKPPVLRWVQLILLLHYLMVMWEWL
jgi:hypothetical protein